MHTPSPNPAKRPHIPQGLTWLTVGALVLAFFHASNNSLLAQESGKKTTNKLDYNALAKFIDEKVNARIQYNEVATSSQCTDAEFIRRVYLDIVGVIPPAEKVREFLDSNDPNKRARLIDELLENPRYGQFFAEPWVNAMLPADTNNRRLPTEPMQEWLADKLNANTPWDQIVHDIVSAEGTIDKNGAITFFVANPGPDKLTNQVTQLFLGVQLQCAQCHDHPFTEYKQDEYWGMAAFFVNVRVNANPNQAAKKGKTLAVSENLKNGRKLKFPGDYKKVPAKFLTGPEPELNKQKPFRPVLAEWMTSKDNRFFARAITNKLWHHFLGRGLVNPVDDMHDDNPASHPDLLAGMAEQLKANDFDLKYLIRAICNSETYQRSSRPTGNNSDDKELFSHSLVRNLTPEQLYDSLEAALKVDSEVAPKGKKRKPARNKGRSPREQFVQFFTGDSVFDPLEYQAGIPQALRLMNSRQMNNPQGFVGETMRTHKTPEAVIEHLYLSTLSRRPTQEEMTRLTQYVNQQKDARTAYGDIVWALVNSGEFGTNH